MTSPDGTKVPLRPQTARVLCLLAQNRGKLVTKESLMREVWPDTHVTDDSLVQCISEIRRALGGEDAKRLATVPKQGYRLTATPVPDNASLTAASAVPGQEHNRRRLGPRMIAAIVAWVAALFLVVVAATFLFNGEAAPQETLTIAVLPFENLSSDPEQDYLSSGLAEDLLTDLSRIGAIKVLSRNTTFGLRNSPEAVSETMKDFGATHMVDGSVQREGEQIRISVQLVQLMTGSNVWAQRYDRQLGDLFDIQDDVRSKIVDALSVRLRPQEQERLMSTGTSDVSAYDLLLRGRHFEASLDRPGVTRAISLYRRALDVDPGYTEAYARLANMYDFSSRFGWGESAEADRVLAIEMAERAVRLDPDNPFARWTMGRIMSRLGRTPSSRDRAMQELRAAIEIDPNYADAYGFISLVYVGGAQIEEARQAIGTAFDLNQTPPYWYYQNRGIVSYFEEAYALAVKDFLRAVEMSPTAAFSRLWLAAAYAMTGDVDAAEWEIEEAQMLGEPQTVTDVLKANPIIQDPEFQNAYRSGLAKAGLPE
nr:winged helix-turn-helix domain-containing protein [Silicimonas algicola]